MNYQERTEILLVIKTVIQSLCELWEVLCSDREPRFFPRYYYRSIREAEESLDNMVMIVCGLDAFRECSESEHGSISHPEKTTVSVGRSSGSGY